MSTGSAQQTSTTTAGVSPFAQNYVNSMLEAGQRQVFNTTTGADGKTSITGIKPYIPFGAPMSAQGNLVPYGGQQGGMGWGAYGGGPGYGYGPQQQYQSPQSEYGQQQYQTPQGGYGQQQPQYGGAGAMGRYDNSMVPAGSMSLGGGSPQMQQQRSMAGYGGAYNPNAPMADLTGKSLPQTPFGQQPEDYEGGTIGDGQIPSASQMPEEGFESWQQLPQKAPIMLAPAPTQQAPQPAQSYGPYAGYAPGTMQAGMGPGEQIAAEASVAGPTALQQKAYETAYNMQTPSQYGQATDIARTAGLGLLNTAGQAQGLQNLGLGALEQGRQYARDITDPFRTQQFMSPYMQNVVNTQQREAKRASDILGQGQKSQAVKAGAFGGARQAIMEAERQRNLATQMGDIQAQGLQSAYQNAQQQQLAAQNQAMQGYTTGIQGYGQGITGQTGAYGQATGAGGTLGNLGGQQLGSQQSIANLQNLYGQQLQQNRQNVLNQAMQNYNMQRMYPQQQLQYLSSMLSGLPVSSTGQVTNIPAPSMASQLAGLGTAAVGAYGLGKKLDFFKKGGRVKPASVGGNGLMDAALAKIGA